MKITLHIWRQKSAADKGRLVRYELDDVSPDMSFLEMLDELNEKLQLKGEKPVAFDHDCREGICGSCAMVINGRAHGAKRTTVCQLYMRHFADGAEIFVEPWRSRSFPVLKDLTIDRSALDRIIQAGGFISVHTGSAPEANSVPVPKQDQELATDAAACIGCGACVAACPNGSAMLFTASKIAHLSLLPQGQPERDTRVQRMVRAMDDELFGSCTNYGECQEACPKGISLNFIGMLNAFFIRANLPPRGRTRGTFKAQ